MPYQIENRKYAFTASHIHRLLPMPHIHSHLEIIYLIKGSSIAVLDNKKYLLEAGELFISFPNQIHFYHDKNAVEGYMIIFTSELFRELKEVFQTKMPENPILHRNQLPSDMVSRMEKICGKLKTDSGFSSVRTFNRAFLKHLDMTPRDYIKQKILNDEK